jgi:hypothetical protein
MDISDQYDFHLKTLSSVYGLRRAILPGVLILLCASSDLCLNGMTRYTRALMVGRVILIFTPRGPNRISLRTCVTGIYRDADMGFSSLGPIEYFFRGVSLISVMIQLLPLSLLIRLWSQLNTSSNMCHRSLSRHSYDFITL